MEFLITLEDAKSYLKGMRAPYVLKADGLAAGKGVPYRKH